MKKLSPFMMRSCPGLLVLLTLSFCVTSPAWGETELVVDNPSFELPACPANCSRDNREGPWTVGDPTGWTSSGARGVFQPNPGQIFDRGFPTEGSQLAYTGSEPGYSPGWVYLTQFTQVKIEDGVTYTLAVDVGRRYSGLNFKVKLLAGGHRVADASQDDWGVDSWPPVRGHKTITVSWVGEHAGEILGIELSSSGDQVSWDNVRLSRSDSLARYVDNGDGTVLDSSTGLAWLKDASCLGHAPWDDAEAKIDALNTGTDYGCVDYVAGTYTNWRLPTIEEFCRAPRPAHPFRHPCPSSAASESLIDSSVGPPTVANTAGDGVWTEGSPFVRVRSGRHWSGSSFQTRGSHWVGDLSDGEVTGLGNVGEFGIWPVRGGQ